MDFSSYALPILSLLIGIISATIALLTYLRVSRKYHSKTLHLSKEIEPQQEQSVFNIYGVGSIKQLVLQMHGERHTKITLIVDGLVCLRKSLWDFDAEHSSYLKHIFPEVNDMLTAFLEINLEQNFFKSLELSVSNESKNKPAEARGTLHYNIYEPRFHFRLRKKRRWLTDLSKTHLIT